MDTLAFEHHLTSPQGHEHLPDDGFAVTAGGGSCCDRIKVSISVAGDRVLDAGFDAHGCGAATAAGSAVVTLVRGATVLDAARIGVREIAARARRSEPGQAARGRGRVRRARARTRGCRSRPRGADAAVGRRAHAGRDERRRRQRRGRASLRAGGRDGRGHARAVVRRRERRRAQLLLGDRGVTGARARTLDRPPALHDRPARRVPRGRGASRSSTATPAARRRTRASAATATCGSTRCSSSPTGSGCDALATGHYARIAEQRARRRSAAARRRRSRQGPDLHARGAGAELARADALPDRRADQARGASAGGRGGAAGRRPRPTRRTCASSPAPTAAGSSRATAASATGSGRSSTSRDACSAAIAASTASRSGSDAGSASPAGEPLYVLDKDADQTASSSVRARRCRRSSVTLRNARLHRDGARVDRVKLRYRSRPLAARVLEQSEGGRHRSLTVALAEDADGGRAGPDRLPDGRGPRDRLGHDRARHGRRPPLADLEVRVADQLEREREPEVAGRRGAGACTGRPTRPGWRSRRTRRRWR